MPRNFRELLQRQWDRDNLVCVGLDSEIGKIPKSMHRFNEDKTIDVVETIFGFNKAIIDATKDLVCAFKPNSAFYEEHVPQGLEAMRRTVLYINDTTDVAVIDDAKRGDIGNTNNGYVRSIFDALGADAVTVQPYLGGEALQPFLNQGDKGIIVLCRTSNPGAGEFQDLRVDGIPLYQIVADHVAGMWNKNGNCAVVVGATYPGELSEVREIVGDMPILIPAIGAQGGDVEKAVTAGKDSRGQGMIINSARGIIFASGGEDFAEAARRETEKLRDTINQYR